MLLVSTVQAVVVVTFRLHNQQSNNFREEQHQNAQWSGLPSDMCCLTAFPFGGPGKGVHCTHSGVRGQCPLRGLWLLTCYILNNILVLRVAHRKVWAGHRLWKGRFSRRWAWLHFFILHIRCVVLRLVAVGIHNDFTYLVQRQQTSPFSTRSLTTLHFAQNKNTTTTFQSKLSTVFRQLSTS